MVFASNGDTTHGYGGALAPPPAEPTWQGAYGFGSAHVPGERAREQEALRIAFEKVDKMRRFVFGAAKNAPMVL